MGANSIGKVFRVITFGESHGPAMGVVIDGCPSGLPFDPKLIEKDLFRRKPGQSEISTQRNEDEAFEVLSGIFKGQTTGTPIAVIVRNKDAKSEDYDDLANIFRPSHADYTYAAKYGVRDFRGGGRQSARETVSRVIAGSVAKMFLSMLGLEVNAYVSQVHDIKTSRSYLELDLKSIENNVVRCPEPETAEKMIAAIKEAQENGDTLGGVITCVCKGMPVGLGDPVFDKLHADLGKAMLSINAVKGFEFGSGFESVLMKGSSHNDVFVNEGGKIRTITNHSGGIQGGISNGEDVYFRVAFKPVATIFHEQKTIDDNGNDAKITPHGRHDPCVVPRAVPIVEAMAAIVLADHVLRSRLVRMQPNG